MGLLHPASDSRGTVRDAAGQSTIVFDPMRLRQATASLFDPANRAAQARPVSGSGRGAAWFVHGEFGEGVLRHYRRGGLAAVASSENYFWLGEREVRSLQEFDLLQHLHAMGLPVPAPIAAWYRRRGLFYRAAIIVERIPAAGSLVELVRERGEQAPWAAVGTALGRCHRAGAHHADCNGHNILLTPAHQAVLIDWDKGRLERQAGPWHQQVLQRLRRSLHKDCGEGMDVVVDAGMAALVAAHDREARS